LAGLAATCLATVFFPTFADFPDVQLGIAFTPTDGGSEVA